MRVVVVGWIAIEMDAGPGSAGDPGLPEGMSPEDVARRLRNTIAGQELDIVPIPELGVRRIFVTDIDPNFAEDDNR